MVVKIEEATNVERFDREIMSALQNQIQLNHLFTNKPIRFDNDS